MHTTKGHPSRWNDKTLAFADEFMMKLRNGEILQDVKFQLWAYVDPTRTAVKKVLYAGAWGLVDNGYRKWSCIQAPAKSNLMRSEQRLSDWIESFRKDSECVFGILKGRFRLLKTGIRLEGTVAADRIWLTCCALHNWLLRADGLSKEWTAGVGVATSDYEGEMGENDPQESHFCLSRLTDDSFRNFGSEEHRHESIREEFVRRQLEGERLEGENLDASDDESSVAVETDTDGAIYIRTLPYTDFRNRLVDHFAIMFEKGEVCWPQRNGEQLPYRNTVDD